MRHRLSGFIFAVVLTLLLSSAAPVAWARPEIFSHQKFANAKILAQNEKKYLLVDFTASWCGPCHHMDETTWEDKSVLDWVHKNAIAVQIDVDDEAEIASSFSIHAMPTVVVFAPGKKDEYDRHRGYLDPKGFLLWMESVQRGETTIATLTRKLAEAGNDGEKEVDARYELAKHYMNTGKSIEAADQFVWLWQNIPKSAPSMIGVRSSFMSSEMKYLAAENENAKAKFAALRSGENSNLDDWITLNDVLGDSQETFSWFDRGKESPAFLKHLSAGAKHKLRHLFIQHDRLRDLGILYDDPVKEVKHEFELSKELKGELKEYDPFPSEAATMYGGLIAADRNSEADAVANESLRLHNTAKMRYRLAESWIAAMKYRVVEAIGLKKISLLYAIAFFLAVVFIIAAVSFLWRKLRTSRK